MLGYLAMTAVVAAGLGLLITTTPATLTALTMVGRDVPGLARHQQVRHTTTQGGAVDELRAATRSTLLRGMAVSGLNPKGLLIFVTLLPQFSQPHAAWPVPAQLATLGLAFTLTCGVGDPPSAPPPATFCMLGRPPPASFRGSPGRP
jgi:threonine/homoserine/homoserine lactone efflux protein